MSETEKDHIISAYQFELSHCTEDVVIQNVIISLNEIDHGLATSVHASFPHLTLPKAKPTHDRKSEYLSQINGKHQVFTASGRRIGIYLVPGYTYSQVVPLFAAFEAAGCMVKFVSCIVKISITRDRLTDRVSYRLALRLVQSRRQMVSHSLPNSHLRAVALPSLTLLSLPVVPMIPSSRSSRLADLFTR